MTGNTGSSHSSAVLTEPASAAKSTRSRLPLLFTLCFASTVFGGIMTMLMSVYLPVAVKDLLGDLPEDKLNEASALINSLFIFGWMAGGFLWGLIADRVGRSKSFIASTACFGIFSVLTALAPGWFLVSVSRFFTGFGIGGVLVSTTILVTEHWPAQKRAIALGILSVAIPVGFFAAGAINNLISGWRNAFLLGIIPVLLSIISVFTVPESPGWTRKSPQPDGEWKITGSMLIDRAYRKNLITGSIIFGCMLIGLWAVFSWAPTWVQGISETSEAQQKRGMVTMIMAAGGLGGSFISGWIVNSIGLRRTLLLSYAGCFLLTFLVFRLTHALTGLATMEIALLASFFGISQGTLAVYIPLLFPTVVRASATGFCFNIGRLFTATVVFFIGALVSFLHGYGNAIFVFSFIFLPGLLVTWFDKPEKQPVMIME